MQHNEYHAAEVVEIGEAYEMIRGVKVNLISPDSSGNDPFDRYCAWGEAA
jgi:hypothetical protein